MKVVQFVPWVTLLRGLFKALCDTSAQKSSAVLRSSALCTALLDLVATFPVLLMTRLPSPITSVSGFQKLHLPVLKNFMLDKYVCHLTETTVNWKVTIEIRATEVLPLH